MNNSFARKVNNYANEGKKILILLVFFGPQIYVKVIHVKRLKS
jgi:hypothetical protein